MILKKSFEIKTIHKFRDEKLHVYKVSTSRNWMCRFYADGKYKVKTTGGVTLLFDFTKEENGPKNKDLLYSLSSNYFGPNCLTQTYSVTVE